MSKLNREQIFNQQFVRVSPNLVYFVFKNNASLFSFSLKSIKAHKCLYDNNSVEYRQRDMYDKAWEDVSKKCGESVAACRRRWRNLKTSTCRYIKQLQNAKANDSIEHREYYLYADMKFVIPFLKSRQEADELDELFLHESKSSSSSTKADKKRIKMERSERTARAATKRKYQEYELVTGDEGDYILQRPSSVTSCDEQDVTNIIEIERDQEILDMTEAADSGEETPHIVQVQEKEEKHPTTFTLAEVTHAPPPTQEMTTDELFLKSLLPDISTMSKDQKRKFKIRVLTLIDEILS